MRLVAAPTCRHNAIRRPQGPSCAVVQLVPCLAPWYSQSMGRRLNPLLLTALATTFAGCACDCPEKDSDQAPVDAGTQSKPDRPPKEVVDLSAWNDAALKARIADAGWAAGACTVEAKVTTCAAVRGVVPAAVVLGQFGDATDATVHVKDRKKATRAIHRDGNNVVSVAVDPLAAAEALRRAMVGDGAEDMSDWGNRTLLLKLKGAGFDTGGSCAKTHEPGVSTWTCQVTGSGLEGTVKLELVPGAPHTSDNGKKIPGKAVLDQGDAALIITLEQGSAGQDLLDDLIDP